VKACVILQQKGGTAVTDVGESFWLISPNENLSLTMNNRPTRSYRNYMMACTALYEQQVMPQYFALLEQSGDGGPGIRNLQELLERAWSEGERRFVCYIINGPKINRIR